MLFERSGLLRVVSFERLQDEMEGIFVIATVVRTACLHEELVGLLHARMQPLDGESRTADFEAPQPQNVSPEQEVCRFWQV